MSLTKTQASCKCGASISTAFTSELADWLGQHQQCLISQPKRERVVFPTMLRQMWSGGEVQEWLDENVNKEQP